MSSARRSRPDRRRLGGYASGPGGAYSEPTTCSLALLCPFNAWDFYTAPVRARYEPTPSRRACRDPRPGKSTRLGSSLREPGRVGRPPSRLCLHTSPRPDGPFLGWSASRPVGLISTIRTGEHHE